MSASFCLVIIRIIYIAKELLCIYSYYGYIIIYGHAAHNYDIVIGYDNFNLVSVVTRAQ